ncbi:MAG: HPr(Ser) kinase/phosphatase [Oscillospiraceae bacterium]|nr:HPr(Ser) kinase/phosphatase [Oscillospiraceae bacterium]
MAVYSVSLDKVIRELNLDVAYTPCDTSELSVVSPELNRPALLLAGYTEYFDNRRIQACGKVEMSYLATLGEEERDHSIDVLFGFKPPAVVVTRNIEPFDEMMSCARRYQVPVLRTAESTSNFMSAAISYLNVELAPRITRHGVFVEVYGEGILILGESGVGKSETAIELVKRGHRLVADDAVELRKVSNRTIVGQAPENIRHFIELRGVGIVNIKNLFGMGAVKISEKVDLVIMLEQWNGEKNYSIDGLHQNEKANILDVTIPQITIPVMPGRNLAIIIETAAMNNRQKKLGYDATSDLFDQLGLIDDITK